MEAEKIRTHDYMNEVKARIPEWTEPVRQNPTVESLQTALGLLLALEKKARLVCLFVCLFFIRPETREQACDLDSTVLLAKTIISICREIGQWKILGEQISLLCKRRAQMPKVCQVVMQQAFGYITETPNDETKIELITTLREVSTGKMYVELERARMTRILAAMEEKAGRASEASALLLELTVETIGAMEVKEKAELLLEQIRLCLITKDFIRAEILMGKVTGKVLENPDLQPLKLEYHNMCESFYLRSNRYLDACRSYLAVYNTAMVKGDEKLWRPALEHAALLCILAPFGDECKNTLGRLLAEKLMDQLPGPKMLLTLFATPELIEWPLPVDSMRLNEHPLFQDCEQRAVRLNDLRTRVTQHNLRTLAAYYTTISYARASELLQLGVPQMEEALADLVSTGKLYAKIDRPAGVIAFQKKQSSSEVLNAWASDIDSLLALAEDTCHMINRENIVYKVSNKTSE